MTGLLEDHLPAWQLELAQAGLKPYTIAVYLASVKRLARFLREQGLPEGVAEISHVHIDAFLDSTRLRKEDTAGSRHRGLYRFFKWLAMKGFIEQNPLAPAREPQKPRASLATLSESQIQALIARCKEGTDFESRRDLAILLLMIENGLRLGELVGLRLRSEDGPGEIASGDVDLASGLIYVTRGKQKLRQITLNREMRDALGKYVLARSRHPNADSPWLWLSRRKGPYAAQSLYYMVRRRAAEAGLPPVYPSQLRLSR